MARRKEAHGGGHGWFVTFADLMGLLVSFFVMLVAFSNQDARKMQAVAGSMRDAFGVQNDVRYSGIVESEGLSTRTRIKNAARIPPEESSITPTPDEQGNGIPNDPAFAVAVASLRQALQSLPDLTEASKHIMVRETGEGLNIDIVDQDGTSMFQEGSPVPYERIRQLLQMIAGPLKAAPLSHFHHRAYLRSGRLAAAGLWPVEPLGRPGQYGAQDPGRGGLSVQQYRKGGGQSRY